MSETVLLPYLPETFEEASFRFLAALDHEHGESTRDLAYDRSHVFDLGTSFGIFDFPDDGYRVCVAMEVLDGQRLLHASMWRVGPDGDSGVILMAAPTAGATLRRIVEELGGFQAEPMEVLASGPFAMVAPHRVDAMWVGSVMDEAFR